MQVLEERLPLSSVSFVDGRLEIELTGNDAVRVTSAGNEAIVKINGQSAQLGPVAVVDVTQITIQAESQSGNNRIDLWQIRPTKFIHLTGTSIFAGDGNDTIYGTQLPDDLNGGLGNDKIYGGGGNDIVHGDDGADSLFGQQGADTLLGDLGADRLFGEQGLDWLDGGVGHDTIVGGSGMDQVMADATNDVLRDRSWQPAPHATTVESATELPLAEPSSSSPMALSFASSFTSLPAVSVVSGAVGSEASGSVTVNFELSYSVPGTVTATFQTYDGYLSATAPSDYASLTGTITFAPRASAHK
ncbi:MAG: hypothetical protein ACKV2Q_04265 [Planctomycetaceae bacterium]